MPLWFRLVRWLQDSLTNRAATNPLPSDADKSKQPESRAPLHSTNFSAVIDNLHVLQQISQAPKEAHLELRFSRIKQHLGPAESHETVRQERFAKGIFCPECGADKVERLSHFGVTPIASYYHYVCKNCDHEFNDASGSPFEKGVPPLHVWMQCWYLMGCTDSINFITGQLGLDKHVVELMMRQLQTVFGKHLPLSQGINQDQSEKHNFKHSHLSRDDFLMQFERLNAPDVAVQPKDTAEYRRQQQIRRDPKADGPKLPGSKF